MTMSDYGVSMIFKCISYTYIVTLVSGVDGGTGLHSTKENKGQAIYFPYKLH